MWKVFQFESKTFSEDLMACGLKLIEYGVHEVQWNRLVFTGSSFTIFGHQCELSFFWDLSD